MRTVKIRHYSRPFLEHAVGFHDNHKIHVFLGTGQCCLSATIRNNISSGQAEYLKCAGSADVYNNKFAYIQRYRKQNTIIPCKPWKS